MRQAVFRLAGVIALFLPLTSLAEPMVVRLRADTWMPFNGEPDTDKPGYTIEVAREIFEPRGITIDYQTMPWSEALEAARAGRIDAVVGANREEAEGLVLPEREVGAAMICLLTRRDSTWQYENVRSFRGVKLGVIEDYSYWPGLDRYLEEVKTEDPAVLVSSSDTALDDLLDHLDAGRIDVLAETETVLLWALRERGKRSVDYRIVYRHEPDPIYMAFAPGEAGRRLARIFDQGVKELHASGRLREILRRYGLQEWR